MNFVNLLHKVRPDGAYSFGAVSHMKVSFEMPAYTAWTDAVGTVRVLEAIHASDLDRRFYQASTSQMYRATPQPQNERTAFHPRSPCGAAKLRAHRVTLHYAEAYGLFAVRGMLPAHKTPQPDETFVPNNIAGAIAAHASIVFRLAKNYPICEDSLAESVVTGRPMRKVCPGWWWPRLVRGGRNVTDLDGGPGLPDANATVYVAGRPAASRQPCGAASSRRASSAGRRESMHPRASGASGGNLRGASKPQLLYGRARRLAVNREALTMSLMHRARLLMQRVGVDVSRSPGTRPEHRRVQLLRHHGVSTVLDVGANAGQYARELRRFGYCGDIVSFEPLAGPWRELQRHAAADSRWTAVCCALGAESREVVINVAANAGVSSSVLPMLDRHVSSAPEARYIAQEKVAQHRLDDLAQEYVRPTDRVFLKLDVQGYEFQVLEGAKRLVDDVVGVQLELSLVPLYEGGLVCHDALNLLRARGFVLESLEPGFSDPSTGQLLQVDGIFFRN
jgi:FkbM family methyltransferase